MMKKPLLVIALLAASHNAHAEWKLSQKKDEMTGKSSAYATSPLTSSTKHMSFPYSNIESFIGYGCDQSSEWTYLGFSEAPNLNDTTIGDGYNSIYTRVKFDDTLSNISLTQEWGSRFLHVGNDRTFISNIKAHNKALVELNWYGQGNVYFRYNLSGATKQIAKARKACGLD